MDVDALLSNEIEMTLGTGKGFTFSKDKVSSE
jgi:hypothetical protein